GSDIHVFHGLHPYTNYPVIQGHEVSGIVDEIGSKVNLFYPGDNVIFMPQVTCGNCYSCKNGMYHICDSLKVMGFQTDGAAQEYFAVSQDRVLKLPSNLSYDEGAMIEPVSVAVHAVRKAGNVLNKKIIVLGAGTIGNLVGQVAKGLGAREVIITDISDFRLEIAKSCGIDFTLNPKNEDLGSVITKNFGVDKADFIFECIGSQVTINQAISIARKGSYIIIVGVFGEKPVVDIGIVQDHELNLIGTLMYQRIDYEMALKLASGGLLLLDKLITDVFPFKEYLNAYNYIEEKKYKVMKVLITLE
ncbi:MAG: zinc-dependent alcohol dehydrogenase, partial [Candidatus Humimicrobiaceae bacterium]